MTAQARSNPINTHTALLNLVGLGLAFVSAAGRTDTSAPRSSLSAASQTCAAAAEIPLAAEQGSAGVMFNFAEHPKSIRAIAKKMLSNAVAASAEAPKSGCKGDCGVPRVVFRVAPSAYLPKQEQQALCLQLSEKTSKRPLTYGLHEFSTIEQFDAWIMQFSQGMGSDGKLLYKQCGGNCDPNFTFIIAPGKAGLKVSTEVLCGFARDRKTDMFEMSTALRPQCGTVKR